ncbi:MAG: NAD-dependent epimerase/dehydratase family protein [Alphaproteobacteria bacterium]|nr:MAG: NAD-dependent epimerase/dehydratase family protein [Alphaproteobacteria bacterium]
MRFLVTGGGGFIGSHLVDRIIAEGHDVVVLDNFASGKKSNLEAAAATGHMRLVEGSILDTDDLNDAMGGVDVVLHLAVECVRKSIGDPVGNHHINATGTLMTLEAARRHKVSRFIYCSSSEVYGNSSTGALSEDETVCQPTTVYGASKLVGELYTQAYLRTYGMETAVVRPFNAFGPREHDQGVLAEVIPRFVIKVLNGQAPIVFGDGSQGRDFTYVTDTADGLWRAAVSDKIVGQTVNLGWGRLVTVRQVGEEILRQCGRNDISLEHVAERPGDIHSLIARVEKADALLGFKPKVDFATGVHNYVEWFKKRYANPATLLEADHRNWTMPA